VVAQTAELANEETALNIRQSRLVASAALIQALGGGWDATQLPSPSRIEANAPLNFNPFPPSAAEVRASEQHVATTAVSPDRLPSPPVCGV
jgi:hypothetical protein